MVVMAAIPLKHVKGQYRAGVIVVMVDDDRKRDIEPTWNVVANSGMLNGLERSGDDDRAWSSSKASSPFTVGMVEQQDMSSFCTRSSLESLESSNS